MLHFNELFYRLFYYLLATFIFIFFFLIYKEQLLFILILPTKSNIFFLDYFNILQPQDIFYFFIYTFLLFYCLTFLPYIAAIVVDYVYPGLSTNERLQIHQHKRFITYLYFINNYVVLFFFCPVFWNFFFSLTTSYSPVALFFEINAISYLSFLFNLFLLINISALITLFISIGLKFKIVSNIIKNKKYLIFLILLISTILTPPEIELQIILFAFLCICLEIVIFFFFYKLILKRQPVKNK